MKLNNSVNVTFSIPKDVNVLLHSVVGKRSLSKFVTRAIQKALEEELNALKLAYQQAEQDVHRKKTIEDWSVLEIEGLNE